MSKLARGVMADNKFGKFTPHARGFATPHPLKKEKILNEI